MQTLTSRCLLLIEQFKHKASINIMWSVFSLCQAAGFGGLREAIRFPGTHYTLNLISDTVLWDQMDIWNSIKTSMDFYSAALVLMWELQVWIQHAEHECISHALTILRLPPGLLAMFFKGCYDILNTMTHGVGRRIIGPSGITMETLLLLLQKIEVWTWKGSELLCLMFVMKKTGLYL